jgi:hypothetical protein
MTKHNRILLFGGHSDVHGVFDDTWILSKGCTYGPEDQPVVFTRKKGKPVVETFKWVSCGGPGLLKIFINKMSSAKIYLNGGTIASPKDFNKNITHLEFEIELLEDKNILQVTLNSKPGGYPGIECHNQ